MKASKIRQLSTGTVKETVAASYKKDFQKNWSLYLMVLPVMAFYIIFCYVPMYGALIAFQNYSPALGILGSEWVGFRNFTVFFTSPDFFKLLRNTLTISISSLVLGFPAPIILALMLNELRQKKFKSIAQTIMYFPHFISMVVMCGIIKTFTSDTGFITQILTVFTGVNTNLLLHEEYFVPIYVISGIWQGVGWSSIIFLAALSGIDQELYEAATLDGAGRWKQTLNVTLPGIAPTIVIVLILNIGSLLSVGYEKIILLYNPLIYNTSDVISSYVYRVGMLNQDWSFSTAVGLFNSLINLILVVSANYISGKVNDTRLW